MTRSTAIRNALVLTMSPDTPAFYGGVRWEGGVITDVGPEIPDADEGIDASGGVVLPGFVQTHIHLCQTLFRNLADGLSLLDWLKLRIWPMEAALKPEDMRASADLGLAELIRGGTTTLLDMGSVEHTDHIGAAIAAAGCRGFIGKAMMDDGRDVPAGLREETRRSLRESEALLARWHGEASGRIHYAFAPRFAPSCTTDLLVQVGEICRERDLVVHTHCAENIDEIALVRAAHGVSNLEYLQACGLTGERSVFAHMVHLEDQDTEIVVETATNIAHCPSSNCKLASGIAPIPAYLERGINVTLGADGAPCNNTLDAFQEMRLAGLLHKPRFGAGAMSPETVLKMATIDGARALGVADQIGSLEVGKKADLLHLRLDRPFNGVAGTAAAKIVYTGSRQNVIDVWCDGRRLVRDGQVETLDEEEVFARAGEANSRVSRRL